MNVLELVPKPPSLGMLVCLNALDRHIYGGTVPAREKARRRARNKRARMARRANR